MGGSGWRDTAAGRQIVAELGAADWSVELDPCEEIEAHLFDQLDVRPEGEVAEPLAALRLCRHLRNPAHQAIQDEHEVLYSLSLSHISAQARTNRVWAHIQACILQLSQT